MEYEDFAIQVLPLINDIYNIARRRIYRIMDIRTDPVLVEYKYIHKDSLRSIYTHDALELDDIIHIGGDAILLDQEERGDVEGSISIQILSFSAFWIDDDVDYDYTRDLIKGITRIANYGLNKFSRRMADTIRQNEITLGPYLLFLDKKNVHTEFMTNPVGNKYDVEGYVEWDAEPDAEVLALTLPFNIVNEEAYAPGGTEYEKTRKTTSVGRR